MMSILTIFLTLFFATAAAFADGGCAGQSPGGSQTQTLEGCFATPDPGARSGCIMEVAANEKDVVLCDLIEIPGMAHDCIDGVAAITKIDQSKCKIMNENTRDHCLRASYQ